MVSKVKYQYRKLVDLNQIVNLNILKDDETLQVESKKKNDMFE